MNRDSKQIVNDEINERCNNAKNSSAKNVGLIGWRGMVGSVLVERMLQENDFKHFKTTLFSTSAIGLENPISGLDSGNVQDANDINLLKKMDVLISCQGSDYTKIIYPELRKAGWDGFWIDAASLMRMQEDSFIILDPINREQIELALLAGTKNFIGGNCTVSLMLLALHGLLKENKIEWISAMTYQAASGAGAAHMTELLNQTQFIQQQSLNKFDHSSPNALQLSGLVSDSFQHPEFPKSAFNAPLAYNLLPWIDTVAESGLSKEEWKGMAEANKILQTKNPLIVDGLCIRVPVLRCHSQALTFKLYEAMTETEIENLLTHANPWVRYVANEPEMSKQQLTPAAVSGTLSIAIGRLRNLKMGPEYFSLFTVGDQLLWGAAEPLRRMLLIILEFVSK